MHGRPLDVPMHSVVRTELLGEISSGRLRPGDQVPTEPQLIDKYHVSRTTVRRALRDLETMGLIVRQPGRGSFVREPRVEPRLDRLTGFVEDMEALGLHASASVELIERVRAGDAVGKHLQVAAGDPVVHVQRVRIANGTPISFDDSYFPYELGSRIAEENLEEEPFYSILEGKYDIALAGADYVVSAAVADERVARLLEIDLGGPVLLLSRTSYAHPDRRPVLFEHLYFAGARISYRLTLDR
ncbi:MAG: GntR family transcriptional regulator [Lapillicoccus sp.]